MKISQCITLVTTLIVVGVISSSFVEETQNMIIKEFLNSPNDKLFEVYHMVFRKTYELDSVEGKERKENFIKNLKYMRENVELLPVLNINGLTDLPNSVWMSLDNYTEDFSQNQDGSLRLDGKCLRVHINMRIIFFRMEACVTGNEFQTWTLIPIEGSTDKYIVHKSSLNYLTISQGKDGGYAKLTNSNNNALKFNTQGQITGNLGSKKYCFFGAFLNERCDNAPKFSFP
jgi:hypothetical protein